MSDKELWELMSIICEGQDSEQRIKVEQYITDLQKEIERLNNIINEFKKELIYYFGEEFPREVNEILKNIQELKGEGNEKN